MRVVLSGVHGCVCAEIEAEEKQAEVVSWPKNANLGRFTNFVNLMDLAAIAVPSGVLHCEPPSAASDPTGARPPVKVKQWLVEHKNSWRQSTSCATLSAFRSFEWPRTVVECRHQTSL